MKDGEGFGIGIGQEKMEAFGGKKRENMEKYGKNWESMEKL